MLNQITIRGGLTFIIVLFVALLLTVIGVGYGALKEANDGLRDAQHDSVSLASLNASSEKLLQVRLALGSYETLFSVGKATEEMLNAAHKLLADSNKDFQAYADGPFDSDAERALVQEAAKARAALVADALEPEHKALVDNDFNTFRTIQGETADRYYAPYAKAIAALQRLQADNQQRESQAAARRFQISGFAFGAVGLAAIVIGVLARVAMSIALVRPIERTIAHFRSIAAGDLTVGVVSRSRNEMGQLLAALAQMRDGLANTVAGVRSSSNAIAHGVTEIAAGNLDLSNRTGQQAAALERTAASIEQMSSTVRQNADNAKEANRLAQGALETVSHGAEVVNRVIDTMNDITGSSRRVTEITGVIEGIAFQTNILALNAAVEAARAGEEGRGFSVVAAEVRTLAQRSATAAKEIKELLGESAAQVELGASLVTQAGGTMSDARQAVERMTGIMGDIESAAGAQRARIEQVNHEIAQIDQVTQNNATLVEEAAAAARSLEEQTDALREAVAVFRLDAGAADIGQFKPHDASPRSGARTLAGDALAPAVHPALANV
ncbi:methyl-accepting chemotaxis protein [Paraburkholderia rhizosphaerae]|uniref:Methyl-accepting chemotaxis sensory transducer with TarH sensor n=1 Tax=Paraburkholderia rhizosphaerae TaxID=480658 RepID=A0A4R8L3K1_9BURK|nr:methyl-accepting chemotaxis protein [Paraburkholderia rhizosphaerae]TDY37136.1 methyl-accepting chemotaxis sensory transducer with TarH sensor [Paraburkholderia rhizosphaerae]